MSNDDRLRAIPRTIVEAINDMEAGRLTSASLVGACLAAIEDRAGEGARTFVAVDRDRALAEACIADAKRRRGEGGPLNGIPITVKDVFDVVGEVTTCGSAVMRDRAPAMVDAPAIARLRAAGAIILGRTSMSEFAYSGIGTNPHYGTPAAPYRRDVGHVAGGSSSGAAVSVADGMALGAVGSDTGGSLRIPAAFCAVVGFKPTRGLVPTAGMFPLAPSFDAAGPMANSVADCRLLHRAMSGGTVPGGPSPLSGMRLGLATGWPMAGLDAEVDAAFQRALDAQRRAGVSIEPVEVDWEEAVEIVKEGRITAYECIRAHGGLFKRAAEYDQRVVKRMSAAIDFDPAIYRKALQRLKAFRARAAKTMAGVDAIVMPTVPCLPPAISYMADDAAFFEANGRALRNAMLANLVDGCALSVPIGPRGGIPVGFGLIAGAGQDDDALRIAEAIEGVIAHA